jgi:hypothetical protein
MHKVSARGRRNELLRVACWWAAVAEVEPPSHFATASIASNGSDSSRKRGSVKASG